MEADEQTRIGVILAESTNPDSPPIHTFFLILEQLRQAQRNPIGLTKFGTRFPFPPPVVMLCDSEYGLSRQCIGVGQVGEMSGACELAVAPVCGQETGHLGMVGLTD